MEEKGGGNPETSTEMAAKSKAERSSGGRRSRVSSPLTGRCEAQDQTEGKGEQWRRGTRWDGSRDGRGGSQPGMAL